MSGNCVEIIWKGFTWLRSVQWWNVVTVVNIHSGSKTTEDFCEVEHASYRLHSREGNQLINEKVYAEPHADLLQITQHTLPCTRKCASVSAYNIQN
jgi:hypothetical protein